MFQSIDNFRDYGGKALAGGGRLRLGLLYRSADLCDATPADIETLATLNITTIMDLRGPAERAKSPSPATAARTIAAGQDTATVAPHLQAAVKGVKSIPDAEAAMQAVYADFPRRPMLNAALRDYFAALAETDGATLIHCAAGKDRTGLAVALLQSALGVHPDDITAEYLLTNTAGDADRRIATGIARIQRVFGPDIRAEVAHSLVTVKSGYLRAAFAAIAETHGNLENYLATLGVTPTLRHALAARLATRP